MRSHHDSYDALRDAVDKIALHLAPFETQEAPDTIGEDGSDFMRRVVAPVAAEASGAAWRAINSASLDDQEVQRLFDIAIVAEAWVTQCGPETKCVLIRSFRALLHHHLDQYADRPLPTEPALV